MSTDEQAEYAEGSRVDWPAVGFWLFMAGVVPVFAWLAPVLAVGAPLWWPLPMFAAICAYSFVVGFRQGRAS